MKNKSLQEIKSIFYYKYQSKRFRIRSKSFYL